MPNDEPDLAPPDGVERLDGWEFVGDKFIRYFEGATRGEASAVKISGFQSGDGTFSELVVHVETPEGLSLPEVDELIANLASAKDEVRRFIG